MKYFIIKVISAFMICAVFLNGIMSCSSIVLPSGQMVENYQSIDDLIKDSPFIVIGTVCSGNEELVYKEITFALTSFKVETILRGEVPEAINILQTKIREDPFIKKGDKMLLFLVKYQGAISTSDAYRIKGLYMEQYQIEDDSIIKNENNKLYGDEILKNMETLQFRINELGYEPNPSYSGSE